MTESRQRIVAIGEVMVELARHNDGRYGLGFGGDTFNTAVYLARAGVPVAYATALGDDPYSDGVLALAAAEGVASDLVIRVPGRMPGLYLIETDSSGERHFHYWRDASPARDMFELPQWGEVAEKLLCAFDTMKGCGSRSRSRATAWINGSGTWGSCSTYARMRACSQIRLMIRGIPRLARWTAATASSEKMRSDDPPISRRWAI